MGGGEGCLSLLSVCFLSLRLHTGTSPGPDVWIPAETEGRRGGKEVRRRASGQIKRVSRPERWRGWGD
eukprot:7010174-Prorocentrum_lima.AAC.1